MNQCVGKHTEHLSIIPFFDRIRTIYSSISSPISLSGVRFSLFIYLKNMRFAH